MKYRIAFKVDPYFDSKVFHAPICNSYSELVKSLKRIHEFKYIVVRIDKMKKS